VEVSISIDMTGVVSSVSVLVGVISMVVLRLRSSMMLVMLILPDILVSLGIKCMTILQYATGLLLRTLMIVFAPCLSKSRAKLLINVEVNLFLPLWLSLGLAIYSSSRASKLTPCLSVFFVVILGI